MFRSPWDPSSSSGCVKPLRRHVANEPRLHYPRRGTRGILLGFSCAYGSSCPLKPFCSHMSVCDIHLEHPVQRARYDLMRVRNNHVQVHEATWCLQWTSDVYMSHVYLCPSVRTPETERDRRTNTFFWSRRGASERAVFDTPKHTTDLVQRATWMSES